MTSCDHMRCHLFNGPKSHFSIKQCLASHGKGVQSLSPLERIWDHLGRRVGHSTSLNELDARLQKIWNEMSQDIMHNLYALVPDRIASCIPEGVEQECGRSLIDKGGRVINGKVVKPMNKYPWIVPVIIDKKIRCGGAIISKKYILTASHCVYLLKSSNKQTCEGQKRKENCYYSANNISIKLLGKKKFGKVVKIKKIITHPKFDHMKIINDIALLELAESLKCSKEIFPICLPTNKEVYKKGQKVTVAGWGKTKDSEPGTRIKFASKLGVHRGVNLEETATIPGRGNDLYSARQGVELALDDGSRILIPCCFINQISCRGVASQSLSNPVPDVFNG
ncbi:serine protease grass [Trichonephila clavipes]|nr:serine protease grass [Trichonephila clavipes]